MSGQLIIEFVGQNRQTRGKIYKAKNIGIIGHPSDIISCGSRKSLLKF